MPDCRRSTLQKVMRSLTVRTPFLLRRAGETGGMSMPAAMGKRMPESIGRIRLAKGNCFSIGAVTGAVYSFGCCRISALKTSSRSKLPAVKPGISLMALQRLTLKPVRFWPISCSE